MANRPKNPTETKSGNRDSDNEAADLLAATKLVEEEQQEEVLGEKDEEDPPAEYFHRELF